MWAALLSVAYILVIPAAARADVQGRWSPWRHRTLIWLGEVSFAFYLVHVLVMMTVLRLTGHWGVGLPGWSGPLAVLGFLVVNLVLAAALHRWVETPMMRRLAPRRRTPPAPPTPDGAVPEGAVPGGAAPGGADSGGVVACGAAAVPGPRDAGDGSRDGRPVEYAGPRDQH